MRWLAELALAIDDAQRLVWQISAAGGNQARASALYGQLETAREEVECLQRGLVRKARLQLGPDWSELLELELDRHTPLGMSPPPEKG